MRDEGKRSFFARRYFLRSFLAVGGLALAPKSSPAGVIETGQDIEYTTRLLSAGAPLWAGHIAIERPPVIAAFMPFPVVVRVNAPMTEDDHVRAVHVLAEKEKSILLTSAYFTPKSGQALVSAPIVMTQSQSLRILALSNTGRAYAAEAYLTIDEAGHAA